MIRIDAIWLATEPLNMRAGADTSLARVVKVFGSARPHHAYLFANQRSTNDDCGKLFPKGPYEQDKCSRSAVETTRCDSQGLNITGKI